MQKYPWRNVASSIKMYLDIGFQQIVTIFKNYSQNLMADISGTD